EQRSQLTQALHMWATRAGGAKQRVAQTKEKLDQENARLPQAEQAFRTAQERLTEARSQLMQAQSRLQLEQANRTHLERAAEALGQRRERLEAERQALGAPDAGALRELEARIGEIDGSLQAARQAFEALQAQCASLQQASARAAEAVGVAEREHAAAQAQLATLRQIHAEAQNNAPLREWLERHGLGSAAQLWQKLRIDAGWETAVEAVLRERLHALQSGSIDAGFSERPPAKASLFEASREASPARAAGLPLAAKVHALDDGIRGERAEREAALEDSRQEIARQEQARHDAEIEQLKRAQAEERYRERSAQLEAEQAGLAAEAERGEEALAASGRTAAAIGEEIAGARTALDARSSEHGSAESALAEQRKAAQQAERAVQAA